MNLHDRDIRRVALAEGKQIGLLEGAEQTKIETAKNLIKECLSAEQIARCTNLSVEKVQELANILFDKKKLTHDNNIPVESVFHFDWIYIYF